MRHRVADRAERDPETGRRRPHRVLGGRLADGVLRDLEARAGLCES